MRQRDREAVTQTDPQELFFGASRDPYSGADDDSDDGMFLGPAGTEWSYEDDGDDDPRSGGGRHARGAGDHPSGPFPVVPDRGTRDERSRHSRRRRNRGLAVVVSVLLIALIVAVGWFAVRPIWHYFHPSDYSGQGSGSVQVVVHPGDSAEQIGQTLQADGVVASVRAFTDAAKNDSASVNIQPGSYVLHRHMSAHDALTMLLSSSSRTNSDDVVVPEGATVVDVVARLTAPRCTATSPPGATCGLGLSKNDVEAAMHHVAGLGLPTDYTADGKMPASVEGFLFPATYPFDAKTGAAAALGQMIAKFTDEVRATNFTASARALHITPYQELIIASIAQSEAKFPQDMPKVARVILNRLHAGKPLQVDATSAYACKLQGLDASKCIYAAAKGPYNTYDHAGLPPTPIGNPGVAALNAAAHPAKGSWLYYVNGDAAGHLAFFRSEAAFGRAVTKCQNRGWCPK